MTAVLSPCRRYRYRLERDVAPLDIDQRRVAFILLNPSTGDERADDPTIRRCIDFARRWGYARLTLVNLFALRSVDPTAVLHAWDPVGPDNDRHLVETCQASHLVVCGWGNYGRHLGRDLYVRMLLRREGVRLHHLGLTQRAQPRHPLYLPSTTEPTPWAAPTAERSP